MPRELTPTTRQRLWYIVAFLALDAVVSLYISATIDPTNQWALPSIGFGLVAGVCAGSIGAFLIATKYDFEKMGFGKRTRQ